MLSLRSDGFTDLVARAVERARSAGSAAEAVRIALTLDGRQRTEIGAASMTAADRDVVEQLLDPAVGLDPAGADRLYVTDTGRLAVRPDGVEAPAGAHLVGRLRWAGQDVEEVWRRWRGTRAEMARRAGELRAELAREAPERILERIDRIEYAVVHMAPVRIYVDDHAYSNLGKPSNLPGKSLSVGHERSRLTVLRRTPASGWDPFDACFVACLGALLLSGPAVRAEEFNGVQLDPGTLGRFLVQRITGYGSPEPPTPPWPSLAELERLARTCHGLRKESVEHGALPYRVISGLSLHKREHLMSQPRLVADAPPSLVAHVAGLLGVDPTPDEPIENLAEPFTDLVEELSRTPAPDGFSSALEGALHGFVVAAAEAFHADVAMSRGPQRFTALRTAPEVDPFGLGTDEFYCCVAPRRAFVERFGEDRSGLVRALSAYSARMRFNTWHYLPDTLGIVEREPGRDDWFFAPTMPDLTGWSDQHHTGHVAFGVRHAIRVPFGVEYDGRHLPGLYDLRLMRVSEPPFTEEDLRRAVAAAALLRGLYQAAVAHEPVVKDFGKTWYERFHG